jgi:hypothetical protein
VSAADRGQQVSGYSGTPLWKKLGIKPGVRILVSNAPPGYHTWVAPLPEGAVIVSTAKRHDCDIVHIFVDSFAVLTKDLQKARALIRSDGAIWVSWPKKSAGVATDVDENRVRAAALKSDLVDVKVCAVTEIWSGLKLVVRKHLR